MRVRRRIAWMASLAFVLSLGLPRAVDAATFTVTSTVDEIDALPGDGVCATATAACSLRAAVQEANAFPGPDTIVLPAGVYTLTLAGVEGPNASLPKFGDIDILDAVTITGAGASTTIVEAGPTLATAVGRVFDVTLPSLVAVSISGITIRNGSPGMDGSILDCGGGGLANRQTPMNESGVVSLTDVIVTGNAAHHGGGICNDGHGRMDLLRTTISGNTSAPVFGFGTGGGIKNTVGASLFVDDSTISGNHSAGSGGGLANVFGGRFEIANTTVSGNTAQLNGAGVLATANSLGVFRNVTITANRILDPGGSIGGLAAIEAADVSVRHTLIAGNMAPGVPDCRGLFSLGYNLVGAGRSIDPSFPPCIFNSDPTDLVGFDTSPIDAELGPLAFNGGATRTHALRSGSPAIDAGDPLAGCRDRFNVLFPSDQRGRTRPAGAACDIGAYEAQQALGGPSASVASATGAGVVTFGVSAPLHFESLDAVAESELPVDGKPAIAFPFGFFSWTIGGLLPGEAVLVTITYPSAVAAPAQYWKVIGTTWTPIVPPALGDDDGDNVITLLITDGGPGDADGVVNGRISDPGGLSAALAATAVPFAAFDAKVKSKKDGLDLKADVVLGGGSNGIAPLTESVSFTAGLFSAVIPPGSFHAEKDGRFTFTGTISGVPIEMEIKHQPRGRISITADFRGASLSAGPVPVTLTIGNDGGNAIVTVVK